MPAGAHWSRRPRAERSGLLRTAAAVRPLVRQPTVHRKDRAMPGQINWLELPAAETAKARTFYGGLFGWGTSEFGGDYHVIDNGPAGAIAPREDGFTHPRVYFATDDIDTSVK